MTSTVGRRRRWVARAASLVVAAVALSGCAAIPTSGPVIQGDSVVQGFNAPGLRARGPASGDDPKGIVSGFLTAQAAGPAGDFDVAQEFLTSDDWDWKTQVLVFDGDLDLTYDEEAMQTGAVTVTGSASVVGALDKRGVYTEDVPVTTVVSFGLVRQGDGQWRIETAEDGLLLSQTNFLAAFRSTRLYFPSADREVLVPDERWFPNRTWQTNAVDETLIGPVEWLRGSTDVVVPEGTRLSIDAVTNEGGVVDVRLTDAISLASPEDRALLKAQLEATLFDAVPLTVNLYRGEDLLSTPAGGPVLAKADAVGNEIVAAEGQVLTLETGADDLVPLAPAVSLEGIDATALAQGANARTVVVRDGSDSLLRLPTKNLPGAPLLTGTDLLAPSVDRLGGVWSGPQAQAGALQVVRSDLADPGTPVEVAVPWLAGRSVQSIRVAHDGARIAVVSSDALGATRVDVAGIVRDEKDVPTALSEPFRVGAPIRSASQVVWADETLLAVLGTDEAETSPAVHLVAVGGDTIRLSPVAGATAISAGDGERTVQVLTEDGTLFGRSRSGAVWEKRIEGVALPAFPG
ncbi:LpqB family beta-propeller domain-containing protein [Oerskovia enterophila]|uniref:Lipoprotein LpqB n=1 Tax=Oerskovia enterophila TaxID=43678 RepID=A0ABX2Y533_9CELL|nr:LpqB family beta-propeller domain-containing protein [Oerskovia enterophila]OCI31682.1 lipoprotein LpqB precursor [Oerskovia enterophila]